MKRFELDHISRIELDIGCYKICSVLLVEQLEIVQHFAVGTCVERLAGLADIFAMEHC